LRIDTEIILIDDVITTNRWLVLAEMKFWKWFVGNRGTQK